MNSPVWIDALALKLLHSESLSEHGGLAGLRDEGLLMSALARPQNLFAYENINDLSRLAAAYAYGISKNHPFVDGNKRAAFLSIGLFLALNGYRLQVEPLEAIKTMFALADGNLEEIELSKWIETNIEFYVEKKL